MESNRKKSAVDVGWWLNYIPAKSAVARLRPILRMLTYFGTQMENGIPMVSLLAFGLGFYELIILGGIVLGLIVAVIVTIILLVIKR